MSTVHAVALQGTHLHDHVTSIQRNTVRACLVTWGWRTVASKSKKSEAHAEIFRLMGSVTTLYLALAACAQDSAG